MIPPKIKARIEAIEPHKKFKGTLVRAIMEELVGVVA